MREVRITETLSIANNKPFALLAGPCQIESLDHAMETALAIKEITSKLNIPFVYKSSYDKANRSSINSKRGVGLKKGLDILSQVKSSLDVPIVTDIHESDQCTIVAEVADILQIPAFLCRQTDLLLAAGKTGKVVNVKKGQFLAPWDVENIAKKISSTGNDKIMLCERGSSFGYNNLVSDFRCLPIMAKTGYPVVFDATHSVQKPGGQGDSTGGEREFVPVLARAAAAVGVAAFFIETHQDPDNAPSDGPNMLPISELESTLQTLQLHDNIAKKA